MASGVESLALGIVDSTGVPALAKVGPNLRVTAPTGPLGVVGDTVSFPGPVTASGNWVTGTLRTSINGLPVVNQTSTGVSVTTVGAPGGPIRLQVPDLRISAD
jgi:hypothetical protein